MCVLICRIGERPLLGANRDEAYARPFRAPRLWAAGTPFWAPRDEEEGGSWIGVNEAGLVVAITNRSTLPQADGRASRGLLVTGALARPGLDAAVAWLEAELERAPRNPCQILLLQHGDNRLFRVGPDGVETRALAPGVHVLSNLHEPDEIDFGLPGDVDLEAIRPILADTSPRLPRGYAVCKYAGWRGTVASSLIEPNKTFLFAGGPPDRVGYERVAGYAGSGSSSAP